MRISLVIVAWVLFICSQPCVGQPLVDHHQHLFSPETTKLVKGLDPIAASDLIALLDKAGIRRALVLSIAYQFRNPNRSPFENEYQRVKAENDWTSRQVALFPDRLRGFCSVNPLKDYAIPEIERCAHDPQLHYGLKLHFGNSDVDLDNPEHVGKVKEVFRTADERSMAIVVHMRSSVTRKRSYGAQEARTFLNEVLPEARDIAVQIAHLSGAGGYDDSSVHEALAVFVEAISNKDPRLARVYFDVSGVAGYGDWERRADVIVRRIRGLGPRRVLFGSDGFGGGNLAPRDAWAAFRKLPLSEEEFREIETNVAPYMR
jgi:predicted TIM-barrel fold metal-dependent hydrolase